MVSSANISAAILILGGQSCSIGSIELETYTELMAQDLAREVDGVWELTDAGQRELRRLLGA